MPSSSVNNLDSVYDLVCYTYCLKITFIKGKAILHLISIWNGDDHQFIRLVGIQNEIDQDTSPASIVQLQYTSQVFISLDWINL